MKSPGGKILHNTYWLTIEMVLETIVFMGSSIAVARYFGPTKLGYYSYINFFISVVQRTGAYGLTAATRKYLSEYVALDRLGQVRAIYNLSYSYQLFFSLAVSIGGAICVHFLGDVSYRPMSYVLLASIVPGLMSWVPAQVNQAFEDVSNNTISAIGYFVSYAAVIILTLHFGWGLVGVAAATFVARTVEVIWRTIPVNRTMRAIPLEKLEPQLKIAVRRFALQAVGVQVIMMVALDRTELVFLRIFSGLEQIAFYSVAVSLATNLVIPSRIIGNATSVTLMVDAVKDPARVTSISRNACRYLLLIMLPIGLGAAAITAPLVRLTYGMKYEGAVATLVVATLLSIPRSFLWLPDTLMRIANRQNQLLVWYSVTAVVNMLIDLALIPHFGAVGAAWGNGLGQLFGMVALWMVSKRYFHIEFPVLSAVLFTVAASFMAAIAYGISHLLPNAPGIALAVVVAAAAYVVLLRLTHALEPADKLRLAQISGRLPGPFRGVYAYALALAAPVRS